jgi:hypothetical protein
MSRHDSELHEQAEFDRNCLAMVLPKMALFVVGSSALCMLLLAA